MTQKSRREMLEDMLVADPKDTFLRYALAMELAREGKTTEAVASLHNLIADQPHYVPAYFQAAQILVREGETEPAAELLRQGISVARERSDLHAAEEMAGLLVQID
ncbi:MAG: tetratricopeptide repeat protein [Planctomycetes bacterium]|nr:tetratricopeptide repeat protein [Planctomycetota bacterium]